MVQERSTLRRGGLFAKIEVMCHKTSQLARDLYKKKHVAKVLYSAVKDKCIYRISLAVGGQVIW